MDLKGKTFDINNDHKKVINTDENFAYFSDGARVKKDILITKYEEVMDPTNFFNNTQGLKGLADDFSKINPNSITENVNSSENHKPVKVVNQYEEIDDEKIDVEEKITKIDTTGLKPKQTDNFFSKIKRTNSISIDFKVDEKFPELEFVKMMNDNYETSIIEHFAREIVEKMLFDPEELVKTVKDRITEIVYGEDLEKELIDDTTEKEVEPESEPEPEPEPSIVYDGNNENNENLKNDEKSDTKD